MWLTVLNAPCVLRLRCGERTSERSCLAGCKRERLVRECAGAKYAIPKCDANGDLGFCLFAIVHDPPSSCSGGQSWHATCGSMMGWQSPRVSKLTGQGLNSVMYAQS